VEPIHLTVLEELPPGLLALPPARLHEMLPGPTLIHLEGRRREPLFVSVLLHGDEWTGWMAIQQLLTQYRDQSLPRSLSILIGNVQAARARVRFLPEQPDFNRIWRADEESTPGTVPAAMSEVVNQLRMRGIFASIDVHNNTGTSPHYACVRNLDSRTLHLATLFSRTVVYFRKPDGVLTARFAPLCPSVTIECGRPGEPQGVERAADYLDACLHMAALPDHPVAPHDIELFHSVAIVKVPETASLGFAMDTADIRLVEGLDRLNFRELPVGTRLGWIQQEAPVLEVRDEAGDEIGNRYLSYDDGEIRTRVRVMPSMLTGSLRAIRQDCLCYLMERVSASPS